MIKMLVDVTQFPPVTIQKFKIDVLLNKWHIKKTLKIPILNHKDKEFRLTFFCQNYLTPH